ncbi:hypothetical protein NLG97_g9760 [Lecanicillium saksenae]|uniref:Uncharacterized protein n=1 Tax=Lecanicillium saksenae TaxID=468837 RepID=A0ACC1QFC5_9HYPO|nr:hypothetical protein NLG97_g9760 [Lecanicillium saksenae]
MFKNCKSLVKPPQLGRPRLSAPTGSKLVDSRRFTPPSGLQTRFSVKRLAASTSVVGGSGNKTHVRVADVPRRTPSNPDKMAAAQPRTVLVLYGSETGNAQDMAEELGRVCQRLHFKSTVEEMNAVTLPALLQNELVVFVISTTGQGDMPHNSTLFWKRLLQRRLPAGCLSQVQYTCFGLGDSTYLKFNWAARKLIRRLDQLGASTFFDTFEADEQFPDGYAISPFVGSHAVYSRHIALKDRLLAGRTDFPSICLRSFLTLKGWSPFPTMSFCLLDGLWNQPCVI